MIRSIKTRAYPIIKQEKQFIANAGYMRLVWNHFLNKHSEIWKNEKKALSQFDMQNNLTELKKQEGFEFLQEASASSLREPLRHLDLAFKAFFRKKNPAKYPKFKSKHEDKSVTYVDSISIVGNNRIKLPKMDPIKVMGLRYFTGDIKKATLSMSSTGDYYLSITYDDGIKAPELPKSIEESKVIGVDLGLTDFAVTDDGTKHKNPKHLKEAQSELRKRSKTLSRRTKGSNSYKKAKHALAKAHEKVARKRGDFQHKLSKKLVDESQAISFETLDITSMSKNKRLAKHINGAGWYSFVDKAKYKCERAGKHFVQVGKRFPSTKTCSSCKHKSEKKPLSIRSWTCEKCFVVHDRDINAAINIKREGIRLLTLTGSPSVEMVVSR